MDFETIMSTLPAALKALDTAAMYLKKEKLSAAERADLETKVLEAKKCIAEAELESVKLKSNIERLQSELRRKVGVVFQHPLAFAEGVSSPICPVCWGDREKVIPLQCHLDQTDFYGDRGEMYFCRSCENEWTLEVGWLEKNRPE